MKRQTADVMRAMIPVSDVWWENEAGQNALDLMIHCENDLLLPERPDLIALIEKEQLTQTVSSQASTFVPGLQAKKDKLHEGSAQKSNDNMAGLNEAFHAGLRFA